MGFVDYEEDGYVGIMTINRPQALNALNKDVLKDIEAAFDAVDLSRIRTIILTGAGEKSFVAGADIAAMSTMTKAEGELGGSNELAMSCDIRICSDNAMFGQPEVGLGITPGFGGTQRLARLIGVGKAKEMVYGARNIKADEAYRLGLVNAVYTQEELMPAAKKLAAGIAKNAPIAVRNSKKAMNEGLQVDMDQAIVIEEKVFGDCFETEDQKEGMTAFLEKRKVDNFKNK
mgnify:CR=1 FL=1